MIFKGSVQKVRSLPKQEGIARKGRYGAPGPPRQHAYGSWGLIAGRAGNAAIKGMPSSIGVGLMRTLGKRILVSPTPERGNRPTTLGIDKEIQAYFRAESITVFVKNLSHVER